jgi:UDP-N-acetylglucosamine acyltransferase
MSKISPLAFIDPEAVIGENCEIGPFCFIDKNVTIGDNNILMNSVTVLYGARIGNGNIFFPGSVISAIPQDLKFRGEETTAEIGDYNKIRENVTINRGTAAKGKTIVGNYNLLMEGVHIAHDVNLGNKCIIGNTSKIAGEVVIDDNAIISACVLIHQFCHVGSFIMLGGGTRTAQDIPPYVTVAREPAQFCGLNLVGLRRNNFTIEQIDAIHDAYRVIYDRSIPLEDRLASIRNKFPDNAHVEYIARFVESSKRGIIYDR